MSTDRSSAEPGSPAEFGSRFQRVRQQALSEIREDLRQKNAVFHLQLEDRQRQDEESRRLLRESGLDLENLEKLDTQEERLLDRFLQEVRPPLASRPRVQEAHLQALATQAAVLPYMGQHATLLGADLATNLRHDAEPVFVWLYGAGDVKLANTMTGSGWGCFVSENPDYPDAMTVWWYVWTPPQDGAYRFWVVAPYSGFRVIRANDSWYNCKYAKAYAFYEVDVYQFFWRGADLQTMIDRRGSNINEAGPVSGSLHWNFSHPLGSNHPVIIEIRLTLDVYAQGSGAHAELNFSDGEGNSLGSPVVFIEKQ
jgi:hypothetical protein